MSSRSFQIRVCNSCGLRYPLIEDHPFGERCPTCLGTTRTMATHPLRTGSLAPPGQPSIQLEALLDNIRSAWNVGSIIRTADGFGLKHVHLCGITPTPEVDAVKKTSLGAEDIVGWTHHKDALKLVQKLKVEGWEVLALEEDDRAISISKYTNSRSLKPTILIAGNEISGVDPDLLDLCDEILFIPMHGQKKSFNVTIAFGIAAYLLIKNG